MGDRTSTQALPQNVARSPCSPTIAHLPLSQYKATLNVFSHDKLTRRIHRDLFMVEL